MVQGIRKCISWLNWQTGTIAAAFVAGIAICINLPAPSILAGVTPLLVIAACLIPCLLPLAFLHRNRDTSQVTQDNQ